MGCQGQELAQGSVGTLNGERETPLRNLSIDQKIDSVNSQHIWGLWYSKSDRKIFQTCSCGWRVQLRLVSNTESRYADASSWASHFDFEGRTSPLIQLLIFSSLQSLIYQESKVVGIREAKVLAIYLDRFSTTSWLQSERLAPESSWILFIMVRIFGLISGGMGAND